MSQDGEKVTVTSQNTPDKHSGDLVSMDVVTHILDNAQTSVQDVSIVVDKRMSNSLAESTSSSCIIQDSLDIKSNSQDVLSSISNAGLMGNVVDNSQTSTHDVWTVEDKRMNNGLAESESNSCIVQDNMSQNDLAVIQSKSLEVLADMATRSLDELTSMNAVSKSSDERNAHKTKSLDVLAIMATKLHEVMTESMDANCSQDMPIDLTMNSLRKAQNEQTTGINGGRGTVNASKQGQTQQQGKKNKTQNLHYKCSICGYGTNSYKLHKAHMAQHKNDEVKEGKTKQEKEGKTKRNARGQHKKPQKTNKQRMPKVQADAVLPEGKPFICNKCEFRTWNQKNLDRHMVVHVQDKPYSCDICGFTSKSKVGMKAHQKKHEDPMPYECDICYFKASDERSLAEHYISHNTEVTESRQEDVDDVDEVTPILIGAKMTKGKWFKCDICDYTTPNATNFLEHWNRHTGEKFYKCNECIFGTNNKSVFLSHQRLHKGIRPFICDLCGSRFTQERGLKAHRKGNLCAGVGNGSLEEGGNNGQFEENTVKRKHKKRELKPMWCDTCVRMVSDGRNHKRMHKEVRSYLCNECGFSTSRPSHLKRHKIIHTGLKPFKCDKCDYRANFKINLTTHQKIHSEETPMKCDYCTYTTYREDHLKRHLGRHKQAKLLCCDICKFTTFYEDQLTKHKRKHEREDKFREEVEEGVDLRNPVKQARTAVNGGHYVDMAEHLRQVPKMGEMRKGDNRIAAGVGLLDKNGMMCMGQA